MKATTFKTALLASALALILGGCEGTLGGGPEQVIPGKNGAEPGDPGTTPGGGGGGGGTTPGGNPGDPGDPGNPIPDPNDPGGPPKACAAASYTGFGGNPLEADRSTAEAGLDRGRIKPYEVLAAEYARVLGSTPSLVAQMADTFGADPPRWFSEPQQSAVTLFAAYRIAFQGCLDLTRNGTQFAEAPTPDAARTQCIAWAERFWSRTPVADEVDACVKVAVEDTAAESGPRRRWAYTCAAVLTSAGFLTY